MLLINSEMDGNSKCSTMVDKTIYINQDLMNS